MTDACAYYVDADGCGIYPYCPAVAYQPPRIDHTPNIGWNAGANSITELNGNFHTVFSLAGNESGVILGLRSGRVNPVNTGLVEHGFFFQSAGGVNFVQVIESNALKTAVTIYTPATQFEIRRVNGHVSYWKDGVAVYVSLKPSFGAKVVNACLYASGDSV